MIFKRLPSIQAERQREYVRGVAVPRNHPNALVSGVLTVFTQQVTVSFSLVVAFLASDMRNHTNLGDVLLQLGTWPSERQRSGVVERS